MKDDEEQQLLEVYSKNNNFNRFNNTNIITQDLDRNDAFYTKYDTNNLNITSETEIETFNTCDVESILCKPERIKHIKKYIETIQQKNDRYKNIPFFNPSLNFDENNIIYSNHVNIYDDFVSCLTGEQQQEMIYMFTNENNINTQL